MPTVSRDYQVSVQSQETVGRGLFSRFHPVITDIRLDATSFAGGSPDNTFVANVTVAMSIGRFTGTLSVGGTNGSSFRITGSAQAGFQLRTVGSVIPGSYLINLTASEPGIRNSPFTKSGLTITGTSGLFISAVTLSGNTFTSHVPSGTVIGTINVTMSDNSLFSGTLSVDDTTHFQVISGTLQTKNILPAGTYPINITAAQSNVATVIQPFTITGLPQTIQNILIDNLTFNPSSTSQPVNVGNLSVPQTPVSPAFYGTLVLSGASSGSFQLSNGGSLPSALQALSTTGSGVYPLAFIATEGDASNSPFTSNTIYVTGASQIISSISLSNSTFSPNGSTPVTVGNIIVAMSPPIPPSAAVISVSGTDGAKFQVTNGGVLPCALQAKATTGLGNFNITLTGTQAGIANSPFTTATMPVSGINLTSVASVTLQNTSGTTMSSGYLTFGHVFKQGDLGPADSLSGVVGINVFYAQTDVRVKYADGSVRHAIITTTAPTASGNQSQVMTLSKGVAATPPSPPAPTASALVSGGYDVRVDLTFHTASGTIPTVSVHAANVLSTAIGAGTVTNFLSGPVVNEFDVVTTIVPNLPVAQAGALKVHFNIRAYADGSTMTDVVFDNAWFFAINPTGARNALLYDVSIVQGGITVYSTTNFVSHYLETMWHHEVFSLRLLNPAVNPNVQYDFNYMRSAGVCLNYDRSLTLNASQTYDGPHGATNIPVGGRPPLDSSYLVTGLGLSGGRLDLGIANGWAVWWLTTQNADARKVMFDVGDAGGSMPIHFVDENTNKPISGETYHDIKSGTPPLGFTYPMPPYNLGVPFTLSWSAGVATFSSTTVPLNGSWGAVGEVHRITISGADLSGYNGEYIATITASNGSGGGSMTFPLATNPSGSTTVANVVIDRNSWGMDYEHIPELSFYPYLITGSRYYLDCLQNITNASMINAVFQYWEAMDSTGTVRLGFAAYSRSTVRQAAWAIREWTMCAAFTPDNDTFKTYLVNELGVSLTGQVQEFIINNVMGNTECTGAIVHTDFYTIWMFMYGYMNLSWSLLYHMNIPTISAQALQMLKYANNWVGGIFTNGPDDGSVAFNPLVAGTYSLWMREPWSLTNYLTWQSLYDHNRAGASIPLQTYGDGTIWTTTTAGVPERTRNLGGHIWERTTGPSVFQENQGGAQLGYPNLMRAINANHMTIMDPLQGSDAVARRCFILSAHAWAYLIGRIAEAYVLDGQSEIGNYEVYNQEDFAPLLSDGTILSRDTWHTDISGGTVNYTMPAGIKVVSIDGAGTASITGNSENINIIHGDKGTTTITAGTASRSYLYGGVGATTFIDNTGTTVMKGGYKLSAAGVAFQFGPTTGPGTTEIVNFRTAAAAASGGLAAADKFRIAASIGGPQTPAAALAACVQNGSNINLPLGSGNKTVTLDNVSLTGTSALTSGDFVIF